MKQELADSIVEWLVDHEDDAIAFLEQLALFESPSTSPALQEQVLALVSAFLTNLSFDVELVHGKNTGRHLFARPVKRAKGARVQLLVGHCDTVWPAGTLREMPVTIADEKMAGPGVFDMKGGLVQLLFALSAIRELGLSMPRTPVVFLNSDEEIGSPSSTRHIARLARIAERAYVLEPALGTNGRLKTSRRGNGRFNVSVTGVSAHAGIDPGSGASAILELSHVIQKLHELNDPAKGVSINVGMVQGGVRPNVVASESTAVVDVRVKRVEDIAAVEAAIAAISATTPDTTVTITGRMGRPPMEANERNQDLWREAKDLGRLLKVNLDQGLSGGASDANTTSKYTATLDGLGPVGDGAHAAHEFVFLNKLVERSALLALLLLSP